MKFSKHLVLLIVMGLGALPGCMTLCPEPGPALSGASGAIEFEDYASCRRLRVMDHEAHRDIRGRMVVTVTFLNRKSHPYKSQVCISFFDEQGGREKGAYLWSIEALPPGRSQVEWTSRTPDAARYTIRVRKAH